MSTPTSRQAYRDPQARATAASMPAASSSGNSASFWPVAGSIDRSIPTASDYLLPAPVRFSGGSRTGEADPHDAERPYGDAPPLTPASRGSSPQGGEPRSGRHRVGFPRDRRGKVPRQACGGREGGRRS